MAYSKRKPARAVAPVNREKAGEILRHGEIGITPLTPKQRGLFEAIHGGTYRGTVRKK